MKYIFNALWFTIMAICWLTLMPLTWLLVNWCLVLWHFSFKEYEEFPSIMEDLPDETKAFYILNSEPVGDEGDRIRYKWTFYRTYWDAILLKKTISFFNIEVKEM